MEHWTAKLSKLYVNSSKPINFQSRELWTRKPPKNSELQQAEPDQLSRAAKIAQCRRPKVAWSKTDSQAKVSGRCRTLDKRKRETDHDIICSDTFYYFFLDGPLSI